jgi:hypothetical protein
MRIPMAVWVLGCLPACDSGCGGGGVSWSARMVIGVEPQTVARDDLPADATALVLRGVNEATFPLIPTSPEGAPRVMVRSEFLLDDVVQSNASLYNGEARIGGMGVYLPLATFDPAIYVEELDLYTYDSEDRMPDVDTWRGSFEVELRRGDAITRVSVDVAPVFDPCVEDFDGPTPTEYPPNARIDVALNSTATCLDGSECLARGTLLDRDIHSIVVAPFVISTRVQAWCEYYAGY